MVMVLGLVKTLLPVYGGNVAKPFCLLIEPLEYALTKIEDFTVA